MASMLGVSPQEDSLFDVYKLDPRGSPFPSKREADAPVAHPTRGTRVPQFPQGRAQ